VDDITRALNSWWNELDDARRTKALGAAEKHYPQWMLDGLRKAGVEVAVGTYADGSTEQFPPLALTMFLATQRQVVEST